MLKMENISLSKRKKKKSFFFFYYSRVKSAIIQNIQTIYHGQKIIILRFVWIIPKERRLRRAGTAQIFLIPRKFWQFRLVIISVFIWKPHYSCFWSNSKFLESYEKNSFGNLMNFSNLVNDSENSNKNTSLKKIFSIFK